MNPVLKDAVYGKGSQEELEFVMRIGGMNTAEKQIVQLWHDNRLNDDGIQLELGLDRKTYERIANNARQKTAIAVMSCIKLAMLGQQE